MASETFGTNGRRITNNDDQMHIRNLKDGKEAFNNRKVLKVSGENKGPIKTLSSVFASQYDALQASQALIMVKSVSKDMKQLMILAEGGAD